MKNSWVTTKQAAEILGISQKGVSYHIKAGHFTSARFASMSELKEYGMNGGRLILISKTEVAGYRERSKVCNA